MASSDFVGSTAPKPIPDGPLECRGCKGVLDPLRRWGGLCRTCVRNGVRPPRVAAPSRMKVVQHFHAPGTSQARKAAGRLEHWVVVECECGKRVQLTWTRWTQRRPSSCPSCHRKRVPRV